MATRIVEANYEAMIAQLKTFAKNVEVAVGDIKKIAQTCVAAIGEEDHAVVEISDKISECCQKYSEAIKTAKDLASAMQEELDEAKKERDIWNSDD